MSGLFSSSSLSSIGANELSKEASATAASTIGVLETCNIYAMYLGYITVLLVGYWIFSKILGLFSSSPPKPKYDDLNDLDVSSKKKDKDSTKDDA
jgi:hypothetical protein